MDETDRAAMIKFEIGNAIAGTATGSLLCADTTELLVAEIYDALERSGWLRDRAAPPPSC